MQRWARLQTAANASSVAVVALVFLAIGLVGPAMTVTVLGEPSTHGVVGGIAELWRGGNRGLAIVLAAFSVAFPVAKLFLTVVASSSLVSVGDAARARLAEVARATGRYSMLDVFVIAVLVAAFQSQEHARIEAGWAIWAFALAIALSIVATHLLPKGGSDGRMPLEEGRSMSRNARRFGIALLVVSVGLEIAAWTVSIRVPPAAKSVTIVPRGAVSLPSLDTPDLYLIAFDARGNSWKSPTVDDAVLGDGLEFRLAAEPPRLRPSDPGARQDARAFTSRELASIEVWDENLLKDSLLDRFRIEGGAGAGEKYRATVAYHDEPTTTLPIALHAAAAATGLAGLVLVLRGSAREGTGGPNRYARVGEC